MAYQTCTAEELLGPLNAVEFKHAPDRLFFAGDRDLLNSGPRVSIVGTRRPTQAGLARVGKLARILVEQNVLVVSGLALGVDTKAHQATIQAGGKTIAVLGTPLDQFYPRENRALQEHLMREHLVISQFAHGSSGGKRCFPMRNRTMALLSDATVIVEAGEKSGSAHQGWEALRLGRPLFIPRSLVDRPELTWPAKMVGYGAQVLDAEDSIALLLELLPARTSGPAELAF